MPPHHWIPVRASDPKTRKADVRKACDDRRGGDDPPTLESFWKQKGGGQLYAIVKAKKLDQAFLTEIGKNGEVIEIEDV